MSDECPAAVLVDYDACDVDAAVKCRLHVPPRRRYLAEDPNRVAPRDADGRTRGAAGRVIHGARETVFRPVCFVEPGIVRTPREAQHDAARHVMDEMSMRAHSSESYGNVLLQAVACSSVQLSRESE